MAIRDLEEAIGDIEARIVAEVAGVQLTYHWADGARDAGNDADRGFSVRCDGTENTGLFRDQERPGVFGDAPTAWVEDDIAVVFRVRLRAGGQREGRNEAITLARDIRKALTGVSWMRSTLGCDLDYQGDRYTVPPSSRAWIEVEQRWTMTRQAPLADATGT